ncbi:MAG: hypothetical protein MR296_00210 [Tenericutes bacterium]|nr:hypothetical protein [Mycoplasmatota bacterium]
MTLNTGSSVFSFSSTSFSLSSDEITPLPKSPTGDVVCLILLLFLLFFFFVVVVFEVVVVFLLSFIYILSSLSIVI